MMNKFKSFLRDESGAITVDWVVLTAAIVALGGILAAIMTTATTDLSDDIWAYMDSLNLF